MRVQLTDYGVEQLAATSAPLEIVKYVLGSEVAYTPMMSDTGIRGNVVYEGQPTEMEIINANVYKYQIGLDYSVGNFSFGEVALYDANDQCVAVGVAEELVDKLKISGGSNGNAVTLGVYLSMVAKNYAMWIDTLASDNQYSVPILETVDNLAPTAESNPNFFIVKGASAQQSSILAYASKDGLWYFDAYAYKDQVVLTVEQATATSVIFNAAELTKEQVASLISLNYFGEKIVEFTSGATYSICRNAKSIRIIGKKVTISFATPLTIVPNAGDSFVVFSRSQASSNVTQLPIATEDQVGAVKAGKYLEVSADGQLDVTLDKTSIDAMLGPYNESGSLLQLSETGDEEIAGTVGPAFSGGRVKERQLTYGALYFAGQWDAVSNIVNGKASQSLASGGLFVSAVDPKPGSEAEEPISWSPKGWIFTVVADATVAIDGLTELKAGDLIVCNGSEWTYLVNSQAFVEMPVGAGFVYVNEDGTSQSVEMKGLTETGVDVKYEQGQLTVELTKSGVTAGDYGDFITVDEYGRVTKLTNVISAGTF